MCSPADCADLCGSQSRDNTTDEGLETYGLMSQLSSSQPGGDDKEKECFHDEFMAWNRVGENDRQRYRKDKLLWPALERLAIDWSVGYLR